MSKFSTYASSSQSRPYGLDRFSSDIHVHRTERPPYSSTNSHNDLRAVEHARIHTHDGGPGRAVGHTSASHDHMRRPLLQQSSSVNQLPPLSSIFAEHRDDAPRPLYVHRSPSFPTTIQRSGTGTSPEYNKRASWDKASIPHEDPMRYTHALRQLPSPQTELPPPPTSSTTGSSRPSGPRDVHYVAPSPEDVTRASLPSVAWSPRVELASRDYPTVTRDTSSSFRPQPEGPRHSSSLHYHTEPPAMSHHQVPHAGPVSGTAIQSNQPISETTTKDSLGPKIWTGTQFLPRFVRQVEVPGEGMCYFYDDGTHCKTNIDGEAVNAHWGVTKAGKPRKRLAIACITCREKKIKCDPDYPRCVQCDKFGRVCKFKNAPRGGQGFLESSPLPESEPVAIQRRDESDIIPASHSDRSAHAISHRVPSRPSSDTESGLSKRRRYNDDVPSSKSETGHIFHNSSPSHSQWTTVASTKPKEPLQLKWPNNPYDTDPVQVHELMKVYFNNIASTAYSFLPEQPFMEWLTASNTKSSEDILLIYAILAVATIWSPNPRAQKIGVDLAKTARFASTSAYSLQVVQARQHFALYYESIGSLERSWDFLGSAIRAAIGSGLHLELPQDSNLDVSTLPLGLNKGSHAETRRRTFWSCYIMDRLCSFRGPGRLSNISAENIFLRMPCDNASFKQQKELVNPFFSSDLDLTYNEAGTFGIMAYLVLVCTIYHDIMTKVWRAEQGQKVANIETFYKNTQSKLERFINSLPPCISHSVDNINKTTEFGLLGSFAAVHAVYRAAMVKLTTSAVLQVPDLIADSDRQRLATKQAESLIRETGQLSSRYNRSVGVNAHACGNVPSFVGIAVADAMKVLDDERSFANVKVEDAQEVIKDLCLIWPGVLSSI